VGALIGVGCDTEERARLAPVLERDPHFLARWYSAAERAVIAAAPDPAGLALRIFCHKEAAIKALWRARPLSPAAVEALPAADGGLSTALRDASVSARLEALDGGDGAHAWAQVLAWEP